MHFPRQIAIVYTLLLPALAVPIRADAPSTRPASSFTNTIGMKFVRIVPGEFMMGSPEDERGRKNVEGLPRRVVIGRPIAIGKFEVTFDQFSAFVTETGMVAGNQCHTLVNLEGNAGVWGPPQALSLIHI